MTTPTLTQDPGQSQIASGTVWGHLAPDLSGTLGFLTVVDEAMPWTILRENFTKESYLWSSSWVILSVFFRCLSMSPGRRS